MNLYSIAYDMLEYLVFGSNPVLDEWQLQALAIATIALVGTLIFITFRFIFKVLSSVL